MRVIVTGGAGFIGSAVVRKILAEGAEALAIDAMTYAASPMTLAPLETHPRFRFLRADVRDSAAMAEAIAGFRPDAILHLAAESHVDRSIDGAAAFVDTNVRGTQVLLDAALAYWRGLAGEAASRFRFHHVSTDEVFGSLGPTGAFDEATPYDPRSPYSASKAASDHLVRAWGHTYGLPTILTNCSNNYGPYQFPEKLIPLMILRGLRGESLPVYGDGSNVRDWLHVEDHAEALWTALTRAAPGSTYVVGGEAERRNIDVVNAIVARLDALHPEGAPHGRLVAYVADRPGHDRRYAIDPRRIREDLGWRPRRTFEAGLGETVEWYLAHRDWWAPILSGTYRLERIGTAA